MLNSASRAFMTGLAALGAMVLIAMAVGRLSPSDAALLAARAAHVFSAMVWVGLIWFVNWIQIAALEAADDAGRKTILAAIVPRAGKTITAAANFTVVTGVILLVAYGYLWQRPPGGSIWIWAGVAGALAMTGIVHGKIGPAMRTLFDPGVTDPVAKARARATMVTFARVNLLLSVPVTFAMLAGAHG